jgi:hypothetical protein
MAAKFDGVEYWKKLRSQQAGEYYRIVKESVKKAEQGDRAIGSTAKKIQQANIGGLQSQQQVDDSLLEACNRMEQLRQQAIDVTNQTIDELWGAVQELNNPVGAADYSEAYNYDPSTDTYSQPTLDQQRQNLEQIYNK